MQIAPTGSASHNKIQQSIFRQSGNRFAARKCSNFITCAYSGRKTGTHFCGIRANIFQNRNRLSSVSCEDVESQEIVMASSRTRLVSQLAFASAVVTALSASAALASQGP